MWAETWNASSIAVPINKEEADKILNRAAQSHPASHDRANILVSVLQTDPPITALHD